MIEAFPLSWPQDWPRSKHRRPGPYHVSLDQAVTELLHDLKLMGARAIILSSNVPLRRDGTMYRDHSARVGDAGIAVYWDGKDGTPMVLACDSWTTVCANVRAIGLMVKAMRQMDRCGAQLTQRAFTGFARLPAGATRKAWWDVLGLDPRSGAEAISERYRELARRHHPDRGGDPRAMVEINVAYQEALQQS